MHCVKHFDAGIQIGDNKETTADSHSYGCLPTCRPHQS
jgi:hypothetical protein